jgi:hypothetical protein
MSERSGVAERSEATIPSERREAAASPGLRPHGNEVAAWRRRKATRGAAERSEREAQ